MDAKRETHVSKFLSLVLRHRPDLLRITLDEQGWTDTETMLRAMQPSLPVTRDELDFVVANNAKQRFEFNADKTRIRASQGHSIEVDLAYEPAEPPDRLYHGTARANLPKIESMGILKMSRHHVHLSDNEATARAVGSRHGSPFVLTVLAKAMAAAGHVFYRSTNGVWLTEDVPPKFIQFTSPSAFKSVRSSHFGDWNAGLHGEKFSQVISGNMEDGRSFHLELRGFDRGDSEKIVQVLNARLPKIIGDALNL
jgi:putative RNA 2'-phosphotransferase